MRARLRKTDRLRKTARIAAVLLLAAGIAVIAWPHAMQWRYAQDARELASGFDQRMAGKAAGPMEQGRAGEEGQAGGRGALRELDLDGLYASMAAYNQGLREDGQLGLVDAWSYQASAIDLRDYGFDDQMAGYVDIPRMGVVLPLYLGATEEQMALGAVQLTQTSMPIGGEGSNCVIAAHRGWATAAMFRDIEELRPGDAVYVANPWGTLEYRVRDTAVIAPNDVGKVLIQDGKDMVTLVTCHPYAKNYERYVVYCDRAAG